MVGLCGNLSQEFLVGAWHQVWFSWRSCSSVIQYSPSPSVYAQRSSVVPAWGLFYGFHGEIQHSPCPSVCAGKKRGADFVHSRKSGHPKLFKGNSSSDTDFWRKKSADSSFPSVKGLRVTIKLRDFYVSVNFVFSVFFGSEVTTKGPVWEAADVADIYLRGLRLNQTPLLTKPTFLVLVVRFPPGFFFYHMRTQWIFSD